MRKLTPTAEELDALRRDAPPGQLIAINLLKFRNGGGVAAYRAYAEAAFSCKPADSGLIYMGRAGPEFGGGETWDFVIIASYSSAASFCDFIASEAYRERAVPLREEALERTLWMASYPATLDDL